MATYEKEGQLTYKSEDGNDYIIYPITKKECVDGIDSIEASIEELRKAVDEMDSGSSGSNGSGSAVNPEALTINGVSYDGSSAVDFTDQINEMIDEKTPTSLPNPNKLKFTGAATGEYDGSSAVTIDIPVSSGEKGDPGVSATHSWNGTVLTMTSASGTSSADLKGATGDAGADGYTPVRGTDYWTDADKAEIKAYVDEAILGGAW